MKSVDDNIKELARFYENSMTDEYRRALMEHWRKTRGETFVARIEKELEKRGTSNAPNDKG